MSSFITSIHLLLLLEAPYFVLDSIFLHVLSFWIWHFGLQTSKPEPSVPICVFLILPVVVVYPSFKLISIISISPFPHPPCLCRPLHLCLTLPVFFYIHSLLQLHCFFYLIHTPFPVISFQIFLKMISLNTIASWIHHLAHQSSQKRTDSQCTPTKKYFIWGY